MSEEFGSREHVFRAVQISLRRGYPFCLFRPEIEYFKESYMENIHCTS